MYFAVGTCHLNSITGFEKFQARYWGLQEVRGGVPSGAEHRHRQGRVVTQHYPGQGHRSWPRKLLGDGHLWVGSVRSVGEAASAPCVQNGYQRLHLDLTAAADLPLAGTLLTQVESSTVCPADP